MIFPYINKPALLLINTDIPSLFMCGVKII